MKNKNVQDVLNEKERIIYELIEKDALYEECEEVLGLINRKFIDNAIQNVKLKVQRFENS